MTTSASVLARPGVIRQVRWGGKMVPLAPCGRCRQVRPVISRGLCSTCDQRSRDDGTIEDYGWLKPDKMDAFATYRGRGLSIPAAARAAGISPRTGQRYETDLFDAGKAWWRATDPNILCRAPHRRLGGR